MFVDPDVCPAGCSDVLCTYLCTSSLYSVTADQTITAAHAGDPRPSGMDLFFSGRVSSDCAGRLISVGCVFLNVCSQGLCVAWSVCVSTPQRLTATPSSRMWKPRQRLVSKTCESCAQNFESSEDVWKLFYSACVESLLCKRAPPKSTYLSLIVSMSPSADHHTCLLQGVWCIELMTDRISSGFVNLDAAVMICSS